MSNSIASNRSTLKEFLASIATIQGDLSNITAPPFVLGEYSTVELPQYWADHPSLFIAPSLEDDPEKRAVLVLKWFLGSLRNQQHAGRREEDGVKKPLNAFLGELFLGSWEDEEIGETKLISEQVSHHPPVTACYLYNSKHGIRAEGFTQQEITFTGSVNVKQKGYAILHIDRYDEDYLIPVPNVKVKGILGGTPYPELVGTYSIISSSGFVSNVKFEGKGFFGGGNKNGFEAHVYRVEDPSNTLYTAQGQWNGSFSISEATTEQEIDAFDTNTANSVPISVDDRSEQDPWESRKAWGVVIDALGRGDMKATSEAKSEVEKGQRQMRSDEEARGSEQFPRVFFLKQEHDPLFEKLVAADNENCFTVDPVGGIWKVQRQAIERKKKPYHGELLPTGWSVQTRNAANDPESVRRTSKAEQQSNSKELGVTQVANPQERVSETVDGRRGEQPQQYSIGHTSVEEKEFEKIQIEEMLRNKYSSASRQ